MGEGADRTTIADNEVPYAITSGNLVHVALYTEIGTYDEGLFVDCVDFDFSLRVRRAGYRVIRVSSAVMRHQLGETASDLPPFVRRIYARHSPARRYYMARNYLYLAERYLLAFPMFVMKLGLLQSLMTVLIAPYDTDPSASYRATARGVWDYLRRRHGRAPMRAV